MLKTRKNSNAKENTGHWVQPARPGTGWGLCPVELLDCWGIQGKKKKKRTVALEAESPHHRVLAESSTFHSYMAWVLTGPFSPVT